MKSNCVRVGDLVTIYDRDEWKNEDVLEVYGLVVSLSKDSKTMVYVLTMGRVVPIMDFDLDIISPAKVRINN